MSVTAVVLLGALAIVLAIVLGQDNIYTISEFYPPSSGTMPIPMPTEGRSFAHAITHIVVAGGILFPIVGWLLGSVVHLATRKEA